MNIRKTRICTFTVFLCLFTLNLNAQIFQNLYDNRIQSPDSASTLSLSLNASAFFHNNEYFGIEEEGYTLTGAYLQPLLQYSVNSKLNIAAGVHLLQYFGRPGFEQAHPLVRIEYKATDNFTLAMGSFNGGQSFHLPYAMYKFEKHLTNLVNKGIHMSYHSERFESQLWLDWEKMILPADTFQEMFTVGSSNRYTLYIKDKFSIALPFWLLAHHKGGQINISDEKIETKVDLGAGVEFIRKIENSFFTEVSLNPQVFFDLDERTEEQGFAIHPQAKLKAEIFELNLGLFYGEYYQSYHGNPILFSSLYNESPGENYSPEMLNITFNVGFGKKLSSGSSLLLRFDSWYNPDTSKLQYSYGLYLIVNELFNLKEF